MGKTKVNHIIPRSIIKNFYSNSKQLYELNCITKDIRPRSVANLFSGRRLWNQELENSINHSFENHLRPIITELQALPLSSSKGFQCTLITNKSYLSTLNKAIMQSLLLQIKNKKLEDLDIYKDFYHTNFDFAKDIFYIRLNSTKIEKTPYLLVDNWVFLDTLHPTIINSIDDYYFCYPVSYKELIFIGTSENCYSFCKIYQSPHIFNLKAISNQSKECKVASSNYEYLKIISNTLDNLEKLIPSSNFIHIKAER